MERLEREEQQRLEAQRKKEEIERMTLEVEKNRDQPVQQSEIVSSFCSTVARSSQSVQVEKLFGEIEDISNQDMPEIDERDMHLKMPGMDIDVRQQTSQG